MTFMTPIAFAAGLLALPVIVALHLLRQRRRQVQVPALDLWHDPTPTVQHRPRRLLVTWPLILRLLAALALALALGRPVVNSLNGGPTTTIVVLDTSTSMGATDVAPTRLAQAQAVTRRLIAQLGPNDELALIGLAEPVRLLARGDTTSRPALEAAVAGVIPAGADGQLQLAFDVAGAVITPGRNARILVLSDKAEQSADPLTAPAEVTWQTFGTSTDNVAFAAFSARATPGGYQLYARVINLGQVPAARTLRVLLDGQVAQSETVRLESGTEAEWSWPLPGTVTLATAQLDGHDALAIDDTQTVLLHGGRPLHVLLVSANPSPLERALRALPNVQVTAVGPSQYATAGSDLVILQGFIPTTLPTLPTWIVAPPLDSTLLPADGHRGSVTALPTGDRRWSGLDLRAIQFNNVAGLQPPAWATVALAGSVAGANGDVTTIPLMLSGLHDGQPILVWNFDPGANGLPNRLQFPLLTGASLRTLIPASTTELRPGDLAPQAVVAPSGQAVAAGMPLQTTGLYRRADGEPAFAVNLRDVAESNLTERPRPSVTRANTDTPATNGPAGRERWPWLVVIVALGLLAELVWSQRGTRLRRPQAVGR